MRWSLSYLTVLAATIGVEVLIAAAIAPRDRRRRVLVDALLLNLLTHPVAVWLVGYQHLPLLPVECAVIAAEACGYRIVTGLTWQRAMGISFACNTATLVLSLFI
jgi:hypothetical protein